MYIGVNNKAKKVEKVYIGINNNAKLVQKIYIGINNKPKLIWPNGMEYTYTGTATLEGKLDGNWVLYLKSSGTLTF